MLRFQSTCAPSCSWPAPPAMLRTLVLCPPVSSLTSPGHRWMFGPDFRAQGSHLQGRVMREPAHTQQENSFNKYLLSSCCVPAVTPAETVTASPSISPARCPHKALPLWASAWLCVRSWVSRVQWSMPMSFLASQLDGALSVAVAAASKSLCSLDSPSGLPDPSVGPQDPGSGGSIGLVSP